MYLMISNKQRRHLCKNSVRSPGSESSAQLTELQRWCAAENIFTEVNDTFAAPPNLSTQVPGDIPEQWVRILVVCACVPLFDHICSWLFIYLPSFPEQSFLAIIKTEQLWIENWIQGLEVFVMFFCRNQLVSKIFLEIRTRTKEYHSSFNSTTEMVHLWLPGYFCL